jgi:hypothetical protein
MESWIALETIGELRDFIKKLPDSATLQTQEFWDGEVQLTYIEATITEDGKLIVR